MAHSASKADQILDAAEGFARTRGFNGFSFRDLADQVAIKSASVHYHFPTKADLGTAVVRRYRERFLASLGPPDDPAVSQEARVARFVAAFRRALVDDGQMCLCGLLGAEIAALPPEVAAEVRIFFEHNIDWLERAMAPAGAAARDQALLVHAALEGAMILARSLGRVELFDQTAAILQAKL